MCSLTTAVEGVEVTLGELHGGRGVRSGYDQSRDMEIRIVVQQRRHRGQRMSGLCIDHVQRLGS